MITDEFRIGRRFLILQRIILETKAGCADAVFDPCAFTRPALSSALASLMLSRYSGEVLTGIFSRKASRSSFFLAFTAPIISCRDKLTLMAFHSTRVERCCGLTCGSRDNRVLFGIFIKTKKSAGAGHGSAGATGYLVSNSFLKSTLGLSFPK